MLWCTAHLFPPRWLDPWSALVHVYLFPPRRLVRGCVLESVYINNQLKEPLENCSWFLGKRIWLVELLELGLAFKEGPQVLGNSYG